MTKSNQNTTESDNSQTHLNQEMIEELQEDIEQLSEAEKVSKWNKIKTSILLVAAVMMSAGQFNDTRDLAISVHDVVVAKFTHELEYELINKINVGNSLAYVKSQVGEPQIIKRSKILNGIVFHYYHKEKYSLTLISDEDRLVGFSILPNIADFQPKLPYRELLGNKTISNAADQSGKYAYDVTNLLYFIEAEGLGKSAMYLTLVRGFIEYAALAETNNDIEQTKSALLGHLNSLQTAEETIDDELIYDKERDSIISKVRTSLHPNYFAVTELGIEVVAESLLTRYEHQAYTRN